MSNIFISKHKIHKVHEIYKVTKLHYTTIQKKSQYQFLMFDNKANLMSMHWVCQLQTLLFMMPFKNSKLALLI